MSQKYITPSVFKNAYTCPHCNAITQQNLRQTIPVYGEKTLNGQHRIFNAFVLRRCGVCKYVSIFKTSLAVNHNNTRENPDFEDAQKNLGYTDEDILVYPILVSQIEANPDMPNEVKKIYDEAREVSPFSTRAATALLRVATERLVKTQLALSEDEYSKLTFNNALLKLKDEKGLSEKIYKAIDALKLFGNEAAHPSNDMNRLNQYFTDDSELMNKLFKLINLTVHNLITEEKEISELHAKAPTKQNKQL